MSGCPPPEVNPHNLFGAEGDEGRPAGLWSLLKPFFTSRAFWLVAIMSLGLTLMREAFTFWTPTYLVEVGGMDAGQAARYSLFFPLFGGLSVLAAGYLSDRVAGGRRGVIMVSALVPLVLVLIVMGTLETARGAVLPLVLVAVSALLMIGPYSFLAGAISLDLGGKSSSSTAAGLVDSAGYLGGILSGWGIGALAQRAGWNAVFIALAVVAALTVVATLLYWLQHERSSLTGHEVEA